MKTTTPVAEFGEVDDLSCNALGMTSLFHYSSLVYMVSDNRAFPDMFFSKVISFTKRKA
jgi:hypothetical protein